MATLNDVEEEALTEVASLEVPEGHLEPSTLGTVRSQLTEVVTLFVCRVPLS